MQALVKAICQKEGIDAQEIQPLTGGQVNQVFRVNQAHVVRLGGRDGAYERLYHETELLRAFAGKIPVARVEAFGELDGQAYQIQQWLPGQKLYLVWNQLSPAGQEKVAEQLATCMQVMSQMTFPSFGAPREGPQRYATWSDYLSQKFTTTLAEIRDLNLRMAPGFVEMAQEYFDAHRQVLQEGTPTLVHSDLTLVNILVEGENISAILDFEFAMQAPADYELWAIEAFCMYPNDWAEEDHEVFCTAHFAGFCQLLQKHAPALFATPHLRERLNLYHLDATLGSYLAWRKSNLANLPPERMAAKEFYMARITNFIFRHGIRLFSDA